MCKTYCTENFVEVIVKRRTMMAQYLIMIESAICALCAFGPNQQLCLPRQRVLSNTETILCKAKLSQVQSVRHG